MTDFVNPSSVMGIEEMRYTIKVHSSDTSFLNPRRAVKAAKIHDGMKVADFGVGSGFFTRAMTRAVGPLGAVYAIDIDAALLARMKTLACEEELANIEYIRGDLEKVHGSGLPDETLDAVLISNLLFQTSDKEKLIEEAWRVLRRGGRAIAIDWKDSFGGLGPHPLHVLRASDAKKLFLRGGFSLLEELPAGAYHWGFIFKKQAPGEKRPAANAMADK